MSSQKASRPARIVSIRSSKVDSTERQQCRKCREIKELELFPHRGAGRQRICKECWKGYATSKTKRVVILNQPENYPILAKRIDELEPRLRDMSRSFANGNLEADDIYGAMVDEILFKSKPEDSDARILTRAKWTAYAVVRRNLLYNAYVADESAMTVTDEDGETDIDIRVSFYESAEDEYVKMERAERIAALISQLEPKYRTIVAMISLGHSQREIAYTLKVSDQSVSTYMKKIAEELEKLGFSEV